jgi:hypothetical protein
VVNKFSQLLYNLQTSAARVVARITEEQIKTHVSKIYENRKSKPKNREKTNKKGERNTVII